MKRVRVALALAFSLTVAGAAWTSRSEAAGGRPPPSAGGAQDRSVSCYKDGALLSDARERQALRTAPEGARRTSAHVLTVIYRSGVQRFVDRRPDAEELDRFHWFYCGYVAALHAHLIGMQDGGLFSGKLLLDRSGRVLDAGATVYPSPDGRLFLAASQTNGEYLGDWVLSDLEGRRLWSGVSGVRGTRDVEYGDPVWIADDALRAPATCNDRSRRTGVATLVREGRIWRWKSGLKCGA